MWGVGATVGPYIMGFALSGGRTWNFGYLCVGILQILLTAVLIFSLPLWKKRGSRSFSEKEEGTIDREKEAEIQESALSLAQIIKIPGAKEVMLCFFCYCAIEQTAGLWASSYLHKGYLRKQLHVLPECFLSALLQAVQSAALLL